MKVQLQEEGEEATLFETRAVPVLSYRQHDVIVRRVANNRGDLLYYLSRAMKVAGAPSERAILDQLVNEAEQAWSRRPGLYESLAVLQDALIDFGLPIEITFGYRPQKFLRGYHLPANVGDATTEVFRATTDAAEKAGGFYAAKRNSLPRGDFQRFRWQLVPEDKFDQRGLRSRDSKYRYAYP